MLQISSGSVAYELNFRVCPSARCGDRSISWLLLVRRIWALRQMTRRRVRHRNTERPRNAAIVPPLARAIACSILGLSSQAIPSVITTFTPQPQTVSQGATPEEAAFKSPAATAATQPQPGDHIVKLQEAALESPAAATATVAASKSPVAAMAAAANSVAPTVGVYVPGCLCPRDSPTRALLAGGSRAKPIRSSCASGNGAANRRGRWRRRNRP